MKKIIIMTGILLAALVVVQAQNKVTRILNDFSEVQVSESIDLVLIPGSKNEALIEVSGVDAENVETEISGNQLHIGMANGNYRNSSVKVTLTYKLLKGVKANSSSQVQSQGAIKSEELYVEVSSSARANLEIAVEKLKIEVSSSGKLDITGKAISQVIDVSSSGHYAAFDLVSEGVKVDVSSSGKVEINVNKEIFADASSSGKVSYKGNPEKVIADTSSSGKVTNAN